MRFVKRLLGSREEELVLSPEQQVAWKKHHREWQRSNYKYILAVACGVAVFFSFSSGFNTVLHVFVRINNYISMALMFVVYCLSFSRWQMLEEGIVLFTALHHATYICLTWHRIETLLNFWLEDPISNDLALSGFCEESYGVLLAVMALVSAGHFHVIGIKSLLCLTVFAPLLWVAQTMILGTSMDTMECLRLGGVYFSLAILSFLGGRRSILWHRSDFVRLTTERSQVMATFRSSSVPIFIVGVDPSSGELQVELWNMALQELTGISVAPGTALRSVACLRSSSSAVKFTRAIELAVSKAAEHTPRMLLPLVGAPGVVWLQVDVSPCTTDGMKAIIIGSDVSEFVTRHLSLLHFVPEEGLGERCCEQQGASAIGGAGRVSAELDPHALTVLECSPTFNILLQRRMRGRPFLNHVVPEDRQAVRQAVQAAMLGEGAQEVSTRLMLQQESKPRHLGKRAGRSMPRTSSRVSKLRFTNGTEGIAEGAICLEVLPEEASSPSQDDIAVDGYERRPHLPAELRSDPGTHMIGSPTNRGNVTRARSEPDAKDEELRMETVINCEADFHGGDPQGEPLKMEAVLLHLIDLSRHFNKKTYPDSKAVLIESLRILTGQDEESSQRWGSACSGWQCTLCNACNDEEDELCEVCKLGEPPDVVSPEASSPIKQDSTRRSSWHQKQCCRTVDDGFHGTAQL